MKVTRIIVLAVALGAGLIAAMLLMNMVGNKASAPQVVREVEEVPSEDVLVASNDIPIGKSVGRPTALALSTHRYESGIHHP